MFDFLFNRCLLYGLCNNVPSVLMQYFSTIYMASVWYLTIIFYLFCYTCLYNSFLNTNTNLFCIIYHIFPVIGWIQFMPFCLIQGFFICCQFFMNNNIIVLFCSILVVLWLSVLITTLLNASHSLSVFIWLFKILLFSLWN